MATTHGRSQGGAEDKVETLLFDLDGTLYPLSSGYHSHIRQNMWRFMRERLGIEDPQKVWRPLFEKYNQTVAGLRIGGGYEFDVEEFWSEVRAGASRFLSDAPEGLKSALETLPQDKYVFTNCNETQAEEALELMGIRKYFKGVYGAKGMGEKCKPDPKAFRWVLEDTGADPHKTAMFEDSFKNLVTAKSLGMRTVFIRSETATDEGVGDSNLETVDAVVDDDGAVRICEGCIINGCREMYVITREMCRPLFSRAEHQESASSFSVKVAAAVGMVTLLSTTVTARPKWFKRFGRVTGG